MPELPDRAQQSIRNVLFNWSGFLFSSIVGFFLSPFVVSRLGTVGYGVWVLIGSIAGYFGLLDLGVRSAVTKYVAQFHAQAAHEDASRLASMALRVFVVAGASVFVGSVLVGSFAADWFRITESHRGEARLLFAVAGLNVAVSLLSGVFGGVVVGLQRFDVGNFIEIAVTAVRTFAIVVALGRGAGLLGLMLIQTAASTAACAAYALASHLIYPQLRVRLRYPAQGMARLLTSFGFYSFFIQVYMHIAFYSDSLVIGTFATVGAITYFVIAANLINYARALISGISGIVLPLASALHASGDDRRLRQALLECSRAATMLILPISITFALRGRTLIALWMGAQYATLAGQVLQILTLAQVFAAGNQITGSVMVGLNRHAMLVPALLAEALSNLLLSIALVGTWGLPGVAWGTTLPSLAVSLLFYPSYLRAVLGIPRTTYVWSTWIRPAFGALPFLLLTIFLERWWPPSSLLGLGLQIALTLPSALLGYWYLSLEAGERAGYFQRFVRPVFIR